MAGKSSFDPMLEMFIFETDQNIEQLEQELINGEKTGGYSEESINEIFRIMHTIKGSSAMMAFGGISSLSHKVEDLFFFLRENKPSDVDYGEITDLVLESVDFIKTELEKIKSAQAADGDPQAIVDKIAGCLSRLKGAEKTERMGSKAPQPGISGAEEKNGMASAVVYFEEGCGMENIRAFEVVHRLKDFTTELSYVPADILDSDDSAQAIRQNGFRIFFKTERPLEEIYRELQKTVFLKELDFPGLNDISAARPSAPGSPKEAERQPEDEAQGGASRQEAEKKAQQPQGTQSIISVNVTKLDKLMDLVGEMVIAEAMVTQNPDLKGLELNNFHKAARQLKKILGELQDLVMSVRMVPLATTFQKMNRVVRDMSKKLGKEVRLSIIGEDTEVDKNIIDHISDPLMHLVRNAIDHGLETPEERQRLGKDPTGTVTLEARSEGSEVIVIVSDDGKGLDSKRIYEKARKSGLVDKSMEDMSEKEIFSLIFLPGFSTNETVTEFSGRGVGMDVVLKNIDAVGGRVSVESERGKGSSFIIRIPLTLAIVEGMNIRVGNSRYTIPITVIKESFRPSAKDLITDPDGNEMIMVRGNCYPLLRLKEVFGLKEGETDVEKGIVLMLENEDKCMCVLADELFGEQQVVVKAMPRYIRGIKGIGGCTLLGDGSISLILDVSTLASAAGSRVAH